MGIRGLMTYINRNPGFLNDYELHGGYLVIDGNSLASQLYVSSGCNCSFGGDYDRYARFVGEFFDDLWKCDITSLVIMDGGMERKKMKTTLERMAEKFKLASSYSPASQAQYKFMPLMMMIIFKTVLRQRGIKMGCCVFEADPGIAGVAKILNCPVLSYDSDFYIFGIMYIPINTLEPFAVKNCRGQGYMKRCKIFKIENLLKSFPSLDASVLPLAAILLGNDYVKKSIFKNFYDCLKLTKQNKRLYNEEQSRIHTTLKWLQNYNLNDAVAAILSKLPKKRRSKVLETIELVTNGYLILPCDMLVPLGFEEIYRKEMVTRKNKKAFKFEGNIDTLESRQLWRDHIAPNDDTSSSDGESDKELEQENSETLGFEMKKEDKNCNETIADTWPSWFHRSYSKGEFPKYFVDLMCLRLFAVPSQIEDFRYPSACAVSLEIIRVIDGLLVAGRERKVASLSYITRKGTSLVRRRLEQPSQGTQAAQFPILSELRNTEMTIRKRIIDDALEITSRAEFLEDIPPEWKLYVAAMSYWMRKSHEPSLNLCHIHAVLFTMLSGIVDKKIGYHRSLSMFNKRYGGTIAKIQSDRKSSKRENAAVAGNSLVEALKNVTTEDCLIAASLFISNCIVDQQLVDCTRKFNVTIVHAFSQFQACLRHSIHLNALLGCPYESPIIAELYNGTMLYNFYTNFAKRSSVEAYISVALQSSQTLLNVVKLLIASVRGIVDETITTLDNGPKNTRKRRNKKRKEEAKETDEKMIVENEENILQVEFVDPQNPFSILGVSA